MEFLTELKKTTGSNVAYTENAALTNKSSLDANVDFFALAGAMRNNQQEAVRLFEESYRADKLTAIRTLFYLRDIRGGQGERAIFRSCLIRLYQLDADAAEWILRYIPEYGRWDDMPITDASLSLIAQQFDLDEVAMKKGESVSLMAKWLPSENTSSKTTKKTARKLAASLGLTPAMYRRKVVKLRKYIALLEQRMSSKDWQEVDYSKIPSQALRKHTKAFRRNDPDGYQSFLNKVERGEVKINTSTLFTYEIMRTLRSDGQTANAMWNNLPDYTNGKNALVIADVSGSMGTWGHGDSPINVSVSLALYFAERNTGPFNGYFMTFSSRPQLVHISGSTLSEKIDNIARADWQMNTDISAAFDAILKAAIAAEASAEDIPSVIYIISDMQFDNACRNGQQVTNFEKAKKNFSAAGFALPHVVFWNVEARVSEVPALAADGNVTLISGLSQSTFRYVVEGKTPRTSMEDIINGERYQQIVL